MNTMIFPSLVEKYIETLKQNNKKNPNNEIHVRKLGGELYFGLRDNSGIINPSARLDDFVWFIHYVLNSHHFDVATINNFINAAMHSERFLTDEEKLIVESYFDIYFIESEKLLK